MGMVYFNVIDSECKYLVVEQSVSTALVAKA